MATCYMGSKEHFNLNGKTQTKARLRSKSMHERKALNLTAALVIRVHIVDYFGKKGYFRLNLHFHGFGRS